MRSAPSGRTWADLHSRLAALVAFLAAALAVACLGSVPGIVGAAGDFSAVDSRWVGWVGVGVLLAVLAAVGVFLGARRVGPGAALAAGAGCAAVGLALGQDVASDLQLVLAPAWLGVAVGCLIAGGSALMWELPRRQSGLALTGWLLPLAAGWPLVEWARQRAVGTGGEPLTIHVPAWLLLPVVAVVAAWGVVDLLAAPARPRWVPPPLWWDTAWVGLGLMAAVGATAMMLLGFAEGASVLWLRPIVVAVVVAAAAGVVAVGLSIPDRESLQAYVAVVAALVCAPSCVQLLLVWSGSGRGARSDGVAALAVAGCGCLGTAVGLVRPRSAVVLGLAVVALGAAAGWMMPTGRWPAVAAAAVLLLGTGAALAGGVRLACRDLLGLGFVVTGGLVGLLFGLVVTAPLGWALTGALPVDRAGLQTVGRVVLGCTVAVAVMAAALLAAMRSTARSAASAQRAARDEIARRSVARSDEGAFSTKCRSAPCRSSSPTRSSASRSSSAVSSAWEAVARYR